MGTEPWSDWIWVISRECQTSAFPGTDSNLGPYYAMDIEVDPVQSTTIAVARGVPPIVSIVQAAGGVAIYDNATQRALGHLSDHPGWRRVARHDSVEP